MDNSSIHVKRICVYGVGGVGGYFGGVMAHQLTNGDKKYEIYFVARGCHLEAIQKKGLILNTPSHGSMVCQPTQAVENFNELSDIDLILLCVKGYDLEESVKQISKNMTEKTIIMPLLNGVDIYERIRTIIKNGIVLPACVYVSSAIERPGIVSLKGEKSLIVLGKDPQHHDFIPEKVLEVFNDTGIHYRWVDNAFPAIWEKYVFIAAFGLVTAYSGKPIGEVMADEKLKGTVQEIMKEIVRIAKARGVSLKDSVIDESLALANNFPFETKTSFQRDVENKKDKNEGDLFGGTILTLGRQYGVHTPTTEKIYSFIQNNL